MEVNKLHTDLKALYSGLRLKELTGMSFTDEAEIVRILDLFKSGFWCLAPFGFETYNSYSLRLSPERSVLDSPVVYRSTSDVITFAPKLSSFFAFQQLKFMDSASFLENVIKKEWTDFVEVTRPFMEYLNCTNDIEKLDAFIHNPDLSSRLQNAENYEEIYADLWYLYNSTSEQKTYTNSLKAMVENKMFLPSVGQNYGLWNNRMSSAMGQQAYGQLKSQFENMEPYFWNYLVQPHGYDSVDLSFGLVPDSDSDSFDSLRGILNKFDPNPLLDREFSKEVLTHPLYDAIQDLRIKRTTYLGEKHVDAAKRLHLEYNDPIGAWNALVTASYWAGRNKHRVIEPMWEAAIWLSESEGWKEIYDVLVQQYEFYNHYKDKV